MNSVLILGINGFIGQHLAAALIQHGKTVTGYDCFLPEKGNIIPHAFIVGDFIHETHMPELLEKYKIDTIFHLISTTLPAEGTSNALREMEENVLPTIHLLNVLSNTGIKLIFVSSGGTVYGERSGIPCQWDDPLEPISSYGIQKVTIEHFLRLYNRLGAVHCEICRVANPYGVMPQKNRTQGIIPILLGQLLERKPIKLYGETTRDYIYISDVIDALIATANYDGEEVVFNIGTGKGTGLHMLVKILEQRAGLEFIQIKQLPIRSSDILYNVLDISQTRNSLNWSPQVLLLDGIDLTLEALRKHMYPA
jgi:UDP-glucose 4-epimerase